MPWLYNKESATNMALYMIEAISNPYPAAAFAATREEKLQTIIKLADIFKHNTTPQKSSHKETSHRRVDLINNNEAKNLPKSTASRRAKITSNLQTPSPTPRKRPKQHAQTLIVMYEEDGYVI